MLALCSLPALLLLLVGCASDRAEPQPASERPLVTSRRAVDRAGQQQDLAAPGAALQARVPIVAVQGRDFASYWCPEILDADGVVLYQDEQGFPARFNVYWGWDDSQRLWLYNTDDGLVWIYAQGPAGWAREPWERGSALVPPAEVQSRLHAAP
jgi:hypothetical protein